MGSIHYEIAAMGFFVVFFFFDLVKRHLPARRIWVFRIFLGALMLSTFTVVGINLILHFISSAEVNAIIQAVVIYIEIVSLACFHCYILSTAYQLRIDSPLVLSESVLMLFVTGALFSSPWTHWVFYVDAFGRLQARTPYWVISILLLEQLLLDLFMVWIYCKEQALQRRIFYTIMILAFMAAVVIRLVYKGQMMGGYAVFLLFLSFIFYLSMQSPDFYIDFATEAYNRTGFFELLKERIAYGRETACMLVRVRNFQSMNQIYGEELLREVQKNIRNILEEHSEGGIVFHVGSSTFAVILNNEGQVRSLHKAVKKKIPTVWDLENGMVKHEYSYYQISYPHDCQSYDELVQRIHFARSDHESRHKAGALVPLRHDTIKESEDKKRIAHRIEEAIMDNSVEIHFQPIYSIEKNRITSLEVLARLKDENRKYINPEYFIHVAEENHTIIPLGEQIFRKACIFASENHIFDYGIEDMNINLSPGQCRYEALTENLVAIAKKYQIPMERMHLEITESEFTDAEAVGRTLHRLKKTGARVALDDFGTGYSTLSNILELPVDFVKIDKSLVWSFAEGKNQFLNDLMPMIKAEGKKIIAEGIETQEHIDIIKRLQGDFLQGYHYSRPLPEKRFMRFLRDFNAKS